MKEFTSGCFVFRLCVPETGLEMTLDTERRSKSCEEVITCRREQPMKVAEALSRVVARASNEGRLVSGITDTAAALKRIPPSCVMFCVLENKKGEDIQIMLFEAFCTEYNIKLIKVDYCLRNSSRRYNCGVDISTSNSDFDSIINGMSTCNVELTADVLKCKGREVTDDTSSISCLLLKRPQELSSEEEFVLAFYETYKYCKNTFPVVRLSN